MFGVKFYKMYYLSIFVTIIVVGTTIYAEYASTNISENTVIANDNRYYDYGVRFVVSVMDERELDRKNYTETCIGVIVSKLYVLTDPSCIDLGSVRTYFVVNKQFYSEDVSNYVNQQTRTNSSMTKHYVDSVKKYTIYKYGNIYYYGLVKLSTEFVWSHLIQPLFLIQDSPLIYTVDDVENVRTIRVGPPAPRFDGGYEALSKVKDTSLFSFYSRYQRGLIMLRQFDVFYAGIGFLACSSRYNMSSDRHKYRPLGSNENFLKAVNEEGLITFQQFDLKWIYETIGPYETFDIIQQLKKFLPNSISDIIGKN